MLVYTIGHSSHSSERFIQLLGNNGIKVVVDVRSAPYSRYASQFDMDKIKALLASEGIQYIYMGNELGGRPKDTQFYDPEGYVLYGKMAQSPPFKEGMRRLLRGASEYCIAIMCSEGNPESCHRHLLISRVLVNQGIKVTHILGDGSIQVVRSEVFPTQTNLTQVSLFGSEEVPTEWKSTQSVLHRRQRPDSSVY